MRVAIAAAVPPLLPPGIRVGSYGLWTAPKARLLLDYDTALELFEEVRLHIDEEREALVRLGVGIAVHVELRQLTPPSSPGSKPRTD